MASKFLDFTGLTYYTGKIKELFVQKETGKGLSSNDYTTAEKSKLTGLPSDAEKNLITGIKRNGLIVSPTNRVVDITVPINVSDLNNDESYMTNSEVLNAISNANHMSKSVVATLPTTGESNVMYLVPKTGSSNNVHEEFLWIDDKCEKIGDTSTSVDLSSYLKISDMVAVTNTEIDTIFASI